MALRDVRDLVRQHAGELRLVLGRGDEARVDADEAAGQREGVDRRVAYGEESEPVRALVRLAGEAQAEGLQVLVDLRVLDDLAGFAQLPDDHQPDLVLIGEGQRLARGCADVRQLAARGLRRCRRRPGSEEQEEQGPSAHGRIPGGDPGSTAGGPHGSAARAQSASDAKSARRERSPRTSVTWPPCCQPRKRLTT